MVKIVQKEDPVLRQIAKPVEKSMFGTPELKKIIRNMSLAIKDQDDAVAIAAPQIGLSLRIFLVSGKVFELLHPEKINSDKKNSDLVFINPKIIKISREKEIMEEGCLSVRYLYGKTKRAKKVRVCAFDENGKFFEMGGTGLLAQIFQHETDHLEGRLFIDKAKDIHDVPPNTKDNESEN